MKDIINTLISYIKHKLNKEITNEVYEMIYLYLLIQIDEIVDTLKIIENKNTIFSSEDIKLAIEITDDKN